MGLETGGKTPKERAEQSASDYRKYLGGQCAALRFTLYKEFGLSPGEITVAGKSEIRDAKTFADKKTLGVTINSDPVDFPAAYVMSSPSDPETPDNPTVLYIAPTPHTSGLLADDKTKKIYTNSFWVHEKTPDGSEMTHVRPSSPVPLDSIIGREKEPVIKANYTKTLETFDAKSGNKQVTRKILADAGIRTPEGIYLPEKVATNTAVEKIKDFQSKFGGEVVIKPNKGVLGDHIIMGDPSSPEFVKKAIGVIDVIKKNKNGIVIEKRAVPPPLQLLADFANFQLEYEGSTTRFLPEELDWNVRVITTLERDPQVIAAEIRFDTKCAYPVNVSQTARIAPIELIGDQEIIDTIYKTATGSVKAVYAKSHYKGDPERSVEWAGSDIILDHDHEPYVMEVQYGAGGFGSLVKLTREPLKEIPDILLPVQGQALNAPHANRKVLKPQNLRQLPADADTYMLRYYAFVHAGEYEKASRELYQATKSGGTGKSGSRDLEDFLYLADKTGNFSHAYTYGQYLAKRYPDQYRSAPIDVSMREALYKKNRH